MGDWRCGHVARISCACVDGEIAILRRQLRDAERLAQIHIGQAWQREDIAKAERDTAKRAGIAASGKLLEAVLVGDQLARDYDAAIKRAEAAEALVRKCPTCGLASDIRDGPAEAQEEGDGD